MKSLIYFNTGSGLHDRLQVLVNVKHLVKNYQVDLIGSWLLGFGCSAHYNELFDEPTFDMVIPNSKIDLNNPHEYFGLSEPFKKSEIKHWNELVPKWYRSNTLQGSRLFVYGNGYMKGLSRKEIGNYLSEFQFKKSIAEEVAEFCKEHQISKETIGIHIRGTDSNNLKKNMVSETIKRAEDYLEKNPGKKAFVCSDEQHIIDNLQRHFPHQIIFRKQTTNVQKIDNKGQWENNIVRSKEAVIEGIKDFLILCKTHPTIGNERSGFYRHAKIIHEIRPH